MHFIDSCCMSVVSRGGWLRPNVLEVTADKKLMEQRNLKNIKLYADLIHQKPHGVALAPTLKHLVAFLALWVNVPLIGALVRRSFLVVSYALQRLRSQGRHLSVYRLLTRCLVEPIFRQRPEHWWYLMRAAVAFVQEHQNDWFDQDAALEEHLILLGHVGPAPLKGYDVAYVFVGYSLWSFERGEISAALKMIQIAEEADPSWGYPAYLHGWYGLFAQNRDAVDYFVRAVQKDWTFLRKMTQDDVCKEHPELLHEVRRRTLVSNG